MRRVDPCGLLTREALAKVGEIGSVGTLFAFDECDIDIKVPGEADRRYASIEVILHRHSGESVAFLAAGLPVYESFPGSCNYLLPLNLSLLPGAQPLRTPDQPFVRIGLIGDEDCGFAQRLVRAVAPPLESLQLPVRDAVATYPVALAERDPCQVLSRSRHGGRRAGTSAGPGRTNATSRSSAAATSCRCRCRWSRSCST